MPTPTYSRSSIILSLLWMNYFVWAKCLTRSHFYILQMRICVQSEVEWKRLSIAYQTRRYVNHAGKSQLIWGQRWGRGHRSKVSYWITMRKFRVNWIVCPTFSLSNPLLRFLFFFCFLSSFFALFFGSIKYIWYDMKLATRIHPYTVLTRVYEEN